MNHALDAVLVGRSKGVLDPLVAAASSFGTRLQPMCPFAPVTRMRIVSPVSRDGDEPAGAAHHITR